jgi:branched-subunit amino acid ABC-type transport system permease component
MVQAWHVLAALFALVGFFVCLTLGQPYLMESRVTEWRLRVVIPVIVVAYATLLWPSRKGRLGEKQEARAKAAFVATVVVLICLYNLVPYLNAHLGRQALVRLNGTVLETKKFSSRKRPTTYEATLYDSLTSRRLKIRITSEEYLQLAPGARVRDLAFRGGLGLLYRPRYDIPWASP